MFFFVGYIFWVHSMVLTIRILNTIGQKLAKKDFFVIKCTIHISKSDYGLRIVDCELRIVIKKKKIQVQIRPLSEKRIWIGSWLTLVKL